MRPLTLSIKFAIAISAASSTGSLSAGNMPPALHMTEAEGEAEPSKRDVNTAAPIESKREVNTAAPIESKRDVTVIETETELNKTNYKPHTGNVDKAEKKHKRRPPGMLATPPERTRPVIQT